MVRRFRHGACRRWGIGIATIAALLFGVLRCASAQEIEPREFLPLPNGTNVNLLYYIHNSDQNFYATTGHKIPSSNLQVDLGLERYVHFTYIGGNPAGFQIYQAAGAESGRFGGRGVRSAVGASNTTLSAFYWPYADFQNSRFLVLTAFLYPPDGSYNKNKLLNIGPTISGWEGWTGDLQVGWDHAIGSHFSYDAALDVRVFADTTGPIQPGIPLSVQQHKSPDMRAQLWLNWAWTPAFTTAVGYEGFFGGKSSFDNPIALGGIGHTNTGASNLQRIRAAASMFLSRQFQLLLEANHDLDRVGGFKQTWGLTLRALYVF